MNIHSRAIKKAEQTNASQNIIVAAKIVFLKNCDTYADVNIIKMPKKYGSVKALIKSNSAVHTFADVKEKIKNATIQQTFICVLICELFTAKKVITTIANK